MKSVLVEKKLSLLISFFSFLLISNSSIAQVQSFEKYKRGLLLSKKSKTKFIKEHKKIWIITKEQFFIKGKFVILNDSVIQIKNKQVKISAIKQIKVHRLLNLAGGYILGDLSLFQFQVGMYEYVFRAGRKVSGRVAIYMTGAVLSLVTAGYLMIKKDKYNTEDEFVLSAQK